MLLTKLRGLTQKHAPSPLKRWLWDREFAAGRHTNLAVGHCTHPEVERYGAGGHVLDLGCGPGRTGLELSGIASYLGVDISTVAVEEAQARAVGRPELAYAQGDLMTFTPPRTYDVILLGDSLYYVPLPKIPALFAHYHPYLSGVWIVRVCDPTGSYRPLLARVRDCLHILEDTTTFNSVGVPVSVLIGRHG